MTNIKIGLEIHGYLDTKEKLFCECNNNKSEIPNTNICPVCTGQPGSKPMLPNKEAIKKVVQISLMLNSKVNLTENKKNLIWQRKHYNWPDLPKGYQNTLSGTYAIPIGEKGNFLGIKIRELHLEEDPAAWDPISGKIDYNRSGAPLVEIVTEPDFSSSAQVKEWLKKLVITLSYIKALNKEAGIKADVNINIKGKTERTEVKNVNSISEIFNVIEYEIKRHEKELPIKKETRRWSSEKKITESMREKESAQDYRFISDPDLPAIKLSERYVKEIGKNLPESPEEKLNKLIKKHKIDKKNAQILANNLEIVEFFEEISKKINPKFALPWVTIELFRILNYNKKTLEEVEIKAEHFIELLEAIIKKAITELKAKQILNNFIPKSYSIKSELKTHEKITDKKELKKIIEKTIKSNKKAVEDYKSGEQNAFNFLMGEVMKLSNKRADYKISSDILKEMLKC